MATLVGSELNAVFTTTSKRSRWRVRISFRTNDIIDSIWCRSIVSHRFIASTFPTCTERCDTGEANIRSTPILIHAKSTCKSLIYTHRSVPDCVNRASAKTRWGIAEQKSIVSTKLTWSIEQIECRRMHFDRAHDVGRRSWYKDSCVHCSFEQSARLCVTIEIECLAQTMRIAKRGTRDGTTDISECIQKLNTIGWAEFVAHLC